MTKSGAGSVNESGQAWLSWFQPGRFLILLGLVIVAGYHDVLLVYLETNTFVTRDFAYFGYPLAYYHKLSFWSGEIPLWNPLNNCGLPFLAQWNTMVLYPGSLFYLLLPLSWSLGVFCLLHLMLGGLGMYFLAWRWTGHRMGACIAGMVFATNGLTLNSLMWPNNISALGWMPWVILLTEKGWNTGGRSLVLAAVIGTMQMLTGAPEIIFLTWLFIIVLGFSQVVSNRSNRGGITRRLATSILMIAGLAAAQLLPFLDLLAHSQRDEKFFESVWPMPGTGWANLLVPLFRCFATSQGVYFQPNQYWTSSYYVGAGTIVFALLAAATRRDRRALVLAAGTLLGLILALGNEGYLYPILKRIFPVIGFMRFPIKFVVWAVFSLPLLAAYGVATVLSTGQNRGVNTGRLAVGLAVAVSMLIGVLVWFACVYPGKQELWTSTALSGLSRAGFLCAGITLALLLRAARPLRSYILIGSAFVLLAGFDPMTYAHQKTPTAPRSAYHPNIVSLDPRPDVGKSRVVTTYWAHQRFNTSSISDPHYDFLVKRSGMFANCNLLEGIPKLDGFYSLYLREAYAIWSVFYFQTNNSLITEALLPTHDRSYKGLLDFIGTSYLSSPERYYEWTPRTNYLALATAGQVPVFADETSTLRGLVGADFDPRRQVFLPMEAKGAVPDFSAGTPRLTAAYSPHRIALEFSTGQPTLVVLSQSHYHPWVARLDGQGARIWKANFAFQAISVPAGHHVIRLTYVDWRFMGGLIISAAIWMWLSWFIFSTRGCCLQGREVKGPVT